MMGSIRTAAIACQDLLETPARQLQLPHLTMDLLGTLTLVLTSSVKGFWTTTS